MSLNFRYICRLCLKQSGSLMHIFSEENGESVPTIPAKIKSFAPTLQVQVNTEFKIMWYNSRYWDVTMLFGLHIHTLKIWLRMKLNKCDWNRSRRLCEQSHLIILYDVCMCTCYHSPAVFIKTCATCVFFQVVLWVICMTGR